MFHILEEEARKVTAKIQGNDRIVYFIGFGIIFLLEIFLFNFRYWQSRSYEPKELLLEQGEYSGLYVVSAENEYIFWNEASGEYAFFFDLQQIDAPIRNIAVEVRSDYYEAKMGYFMSTVENPIRTNIVEIAAFGIGEKESFELPGYYAGQEKGKADIFAAPSKIKDSRYLLLQFQSLYGEGKAPIVLSSVRINVPVPFSFSIPRFGILFCMFVLVMSLCPGSLLWKRPVLGEDGRLSVKAKSELLILVIFCSVLFVFLVKHNEFYSSNNELRPFYNDLAHALSHGSVSLDMEPDPALMTLEDPYDYTERMETGVDWALDYAYYNGKYYVYYGIVPCLLFYFPMWFIFGVDIMSWTVLCMLAFLFLVGESMLLSELFRRYRPRGSQALFTLMWIVLTTCVSLPYVAAMSTTYFIPLFSGLVFFIYGLWFYLIALRAEKEGDESKVRIFLALGSLCMAVIAGCRPPQIFAVGVCLPLVLPMFSGMLKRKEYVKARHRLGCFALPYVIVALSLMYYNYIRFGSYFQFGAEYNLTIACVKSGFNIENTIAGMRYFLFRILALKKEFPYIEYSALSWNNPYQIANVSSGNGLFIMYPFLFAGLISYIKKGKTKLEKEGYRVARTMFLLGLLILAIVSNMVGLIGRYRLDFSFYFALSAVYVLLLFHMDDQNKAKNLLKWVGIVLICICIINNMMTYFMPGELAGIRELSQNFYADIVHMVEFWR